MPEAEPEPKSYQNTYHGSSNPKVTSYIKPMLAKLHDKIFDNPNWVYEIKWDGYRAIAEIKGNDTLLYSRNGLSFKEDYPIVYQELQKIKGNVIIDGEIVGLDDNGVSKFQLLQNYGQNKNINLCYYVFDCLAVAGKSIEDKTLLERKQILKDLLPESDIIKYCDHITEQGTAFFKISQQQHLEGIIAKKAESSYIEDSRSNDWLKVKNVIMEEAVIAGFTEPRGGRKFFGALVLGVYEKNKLTYIGHTGTGFTDKTLKEVYNQLIELKTDKSPFDTKVPVNSPVTWVKPELVCNLKYSEITGDGHRRHPVFMGLRIDKQPEDVHADFPMEKNTNNMVEETKPIKKAAPKKAAAKPAAKKESDNETAGAPKQTAGKEVPFSHLDKVFWPEEGYTKGDVINYYDKIYKYIIPYIKNRPESLLRMPNGIAEKGFFQKDAGVHAPEWVTKQKLYSESVEKDIEYIVCNDKPTLLYMANLGCIEINPWNSQLGSLDNPDWLVMDLDPSDNNTFGQVIEAANVIKDILGKAGAACYPKTSGATGIHVYVPLAAKYNYEHAKEFAHMIASLAHEQLPEFTSLERSLAKRGKDHIYIDYLQNRRGQTLSCAYSLRPKKGASVSTPLEWDEVRPGLHPTNFTINNIFERLEKKGDLFAPVLKKGIDMVKCIGKLGG